MSPTRREPIFIALKVDPIGCSEILGVYETEASAKALCEASAGDPIKWMDGPPWSGETERLSHRYTYTVERHELEP
jgi:hypothetical protein